ncbi:cytochrome P450/oxidoreductase [Nocardioides nitrophenolicus]|uniref:cytochrome P450/oxidoreductase n=1 Tax=Nocardioides nitrophenolicus TaxID=60489 RepID=UPI00195EF779|nr:cytochrome P450 [Nocardioides nitrophenolicus]MBM7516995.1 cytochrome P450/ferredoxin-NADP reductase [Nocardioides nitrophenolicus]
MSTYEKFDHHSAECRDDIVGYYAAFRDKCPVGRSDAHENGYVYLTRYADVFHVARNDALFSSTRAAGNLEGTAIVIPSGPFGGNMQQPLELDPPDNVEYRRLLDLILSPAAVDELRPMIARHASRIVDEFIESGSVDLVEVLTNPLPSAVTLDWIGFPEEDWMRIGRPIHDVFTSEPGSERAQRAYEGMAYMEKRLAELIAERRAHPGDDVISRLIAERKADGSEFTDAELFSVIGIAITGGVDTTTSLTGSVLVHLDEHPEMRQQLIDAPDLLVDGTDEFLRRYGSVTAMSRTTTTDTEIGGCPVRAGERVLVPWFAANHDPEVFSEPHEVRLDRDASRHLTFGIGTHRCPGAHLARAMFQEMIHQVLTRLPDYKVDRAGVVGYASRGNHMGWDVIPATFTPGPRVGDRVDRFQGASHGAETYDVVLDAVDVVADDVVAITVRAADGGTLPRWQPGAHLEVRLPSGRLRQYSLCGADPASYRFAVLREREGRGGSEELHEIAVAGRELTVRGPRNHFPLVDADGHLLIAGGIGVTPILAMARDLSTRGRPARVLYGGRSRGTMAFADELSALPGIEVDLVPQDEHGLPDLHGAIAATPAGTAIYCCGPGAMIAEVQRVCDELGRGRDLHVERFAASDEMEARLTSTEGNVPFEVELRRTGVTVDVPVDKRLIEVIREAVPGIAYDCEKGFCGSCETRVLEGAPDHRDEVLSEAEQATGRSMMICVSRSCTPKLVLDL